MTAKEIAMYDAKHPNAAGSSASAAATNPVSNGAPENGTEQAGAVIGKSVDVKA